LENKTKILGKQIKNIKLVILISFLVQGGAERRT
jgi:hypothetical protein